MDARWITQQFCLFINSVLTDKGMTHQQVADTTGMTRPSVTRALNGSHTPTLQTIIKIADAVGVSITMTPDVKK